MDRFIKFLRDEEGATAIEYALIAALIAVVIAVALTPLGKKLADIFESITATLSTAVP
jgi:pilus assembly protein Flp/PilA